MFRPEFCYCAGFSISNYCTCNVRSNSIRPPFVSVHAYSRLSEPCNLLAMLLLNLFSLFLAIHPVHSLATAFHNPRKPNCIEPAPRRLPKIEDCLDVIRQIRKQAADSHNRLFTVSRRISSNIHMPTTWWDHAPGSTCAIHLDMIDRRSDASDEMRLIDVLRTAEEIIEECLSPREFEGWEGTTGVSASFADPWSPTYHW